MLRFVAPSFLANQCGARNSATNNTVVHLRSGDVWRNGSDGRAAWPTHAQPPCAFYECALGKRPFEIVTNPDDPPHPCLANLAPRALPPQNNHSGVMDDLCRLATASELVLGLSAFSAMGFLLNRQVSKVVVPFADYARKNPTSPLHPLWEDAVDDQQRGYSKVAVDFPGFSWVDDALVDVLG